MEEEMNKFMQLGAALGGAALVVAAGSAYTAANTMTDDPYMGYGTNGVTGVTATNAAYTYSGAGATLTLDKVVYTISDVLTADDDVTAELTKNGAGTPVDCIVTVPSTITCGGVDPDDLGWSVATLTSIDLAVETTASQ